MSMYKSLVYREVDIVSALTSVSKGGRGTTTHARIIIPALQQLLPHLNL